MSKKKGSRRLGCALMPIITIIITTIMIKYILLLLLLLLGRCC